MRHQKVKILSFFLAVFIAVASFPALKTNAATIASGSCGTGVTYTLDDSGKLTIQGSGAMTNFASTSVVPWYSNRSKITSVEIKSGVTNIGSCAFKSHSYLTSVSIPSTVTSIGKDAFNGCSRLTSVTIPNSVTSIGGSAFLSCSKLATLTLSSKLTTIPEYCFKSCSALTSVTIPSGVKTIEKQAFYGDKNITSATIPSTVTDIGESAFFGCEKLNNVTLPSGLNTLGRSAFNGCKALTKITVPQYITTLSEYTFAYCSNLTTVSLPANILKLETGVFQYCSSLTTINIPNGITSIGDAFTNCTSLTSFTIPSSVQEFGELTLSGTGVREVTYNGTHEQFLAIHVLVNDEENMTMDDVFAKLNISVIFAGGTSVSITSQPKDFTGKVGTTATFSVRAQGNGLTYKWYEYADSQWIECEYTGYNTATLKVNIACALDGHKFSCEVSDQYGHSVTSNNATLTIDRVPLKINKQPADFSGPAGDTATFTVTAQGDELTYQWLVFKDGEWTNCSKDWGGKTNTMSFEIKNSYDGYKYHCVIKDGYGNKVTTNDVTLSIKTPLVITAQPSDFSGYIGETATFTVAAQGDELSYQWQVFKDGEWSNSSKDYGAKTPTLSFEIKSTHNGYKYHCIITDSYGTSITTNDVTLTTKTALSITSQPTNLSGFIGETATFTVGAQGDNLSYQWQVFKDGEWSNSAREYGAKTDTLSFEIKSTHNGYKYHCIITDGYGNTATTIDVTLTAKTVLAITSQPSDVSGYLGETATFTVAAQGDNLSYQWQVFKDGEWSNSAREYGAKTDTLSFEIKNVHNGYKYHCIITDGYGNTVTTKDVTLTAMTVLAINTQPSDCSGYIGETATFTVAAQGDNLTYQWQVLKDGEWTNSAKEYGAKTETLSFEIKSVHSAYKYRCVITDAYGNTVTTNNVSITVKTPLVISTQPSDFSGSVGDTATFSVEAQGDNLSYQWKVNRDGNWINASYSGAATSTMSVDLEPALNGLEFRCTVTDGYGTSVNSRVVSLSVESNVFEITKNPSNYSGPIGDIAQFTVKAQGTGLTYQWQINKTGTWKNVTSEGYNTNTLAVAITETRDGYMYRCKVTDASGETLVSKSATLTVDQSGVYISSHPVNVSGPVGDIAVFTVEAQGENLTYQWQINKTGTWKNVTSEGYNTNTLPIEITAARNGYKYRCKVSDDTKTVVSNAATLTAESQPLVISAHPQDFSGSVGDVATFSIRAQGDGLTYQWQINKSGTWKNVTSAGYNTATLKIDVTEARNGYKYRCKVTDASGITVPSNAATLTVVQPNITIVKQPENASGAIGEIAIFSVEAQGDGLTYQWQINKTGTWKNVTSEGFNTNTLPIEITAARNGYKYRCKITDANGKTVVSDEAFLKVIEASANSGFKNEIDLGNSTVIPNNQVCVESENTAAPIEASDAVETIDAVEIVEVIEPVIDTTSEAEVTETVDEQVS